MGIFPKSRASYGEGKWDIMTKIINWNDLSPLIF